MLPTGYRRGVIDGHAVIVEVQLARDADKRFASDPLRADRQSVALDLDLVRGGVATYFDVRPKYTIADIAAYLLSLK